MNHPTDKSTQPYSREFYQFKKGWTHDSADAVIAELLQTISPKSVVDVGCGTGTWLATCINYGIDDVLGVDGDYVEKEMLEIPEQQFLSYDLSKPLNLNRKFDLAISLEVAEHLSEDYAKSFVNTLTDAAPVILFSAAIPHQGGVNHINEQWQDYWCNLFVEKNYLPNDAIRKKIWLNDKVADHYAQNIILYVNKDYATQHPMLLQGIEQTDINFLNVVHPGRYLKKVNRIESLIKSNDYLQQQLKNMQNPQYMSLSRHLSILPKLIVNAVSNRFKKTLS